MRERTASVVLDSWKLPYFKRELDGASFDYSEIPGPLQGTTTLLVTFEQFRIDTLTRTIRTSEANAQSARRQSGGKP